MKTIKRIFNPALAILVATGLTFNFTACSKETPIGPTVNAQQETGSVNALVKGRMKGRHAYAGGKIRLSQGFRFELPKDSLTPPPELQGEDVTITMTYTHDEPNNQFLFDFGPSGSQFDPPATAWFHYPDSYGSDVPKVYYVHPDGTYEELEPEEVDTSNQLIRLSIHHFSRYAVAWAN